MKQRERDEKMVETRTDLIKKGKFDKRRKKSLRKRRRWRKKMSEMTLY